MYNERYSKVSGNIKGQEITLMIFDEFAVIKPSLYIGLKTTAELLNEMAP